MIKIPTKAEVKSDPNILFQNKPASPVGDKVLEVDVVANRCVYLNSYRIAGGKPYVSENLPSNTLKTSLKQVLSAFKEEDVLAALNERRREREYFAAYHAQGEGN